MPRIVLASALALTLTAALAACDPVEPMPKPTPSPTYAVTGDGVLRIGTLVPTASSIGAAQVAGVEAAIREINEAGGVNGVPVEVYHRNSGDVTTDTAETAYADLVAKGVDVVIGPSSSALVESLVGPVTTAQVPLISPAASQHAVSALADDGLIFRTIGDYVDQGAVLAQELAAEKVTKVAYLYLDTVDAEALLGTLTTALEGEGLTLAHSASYAASATTFTSVVSKVVKAKPDAVVIASTVEQFDQTAALIGALAASNLGGPKLWLTSQSYADYSSVLAAGELEGAHALLEGAVPDAGFAARLRQADPGLATYRYAAEAYDATVLAALAAVRAGDDGGPAIARLLPAVSKAGIGCTSFGACLDVLRTEPEIDYNGVSSPVNLSEAGDVAASPWGLYAYSATGSPTLVRAVIVS